MQKFIIYVDVDDTLIHTTSGKRIRIPSIISHIKDLKQQGAVLYCWSSGGADYAQMVAEELNIVDLFTAFLSKPNMLLDDQEIKDWKYLIEVHPISCNSKTLDNYKQQLANKVKIDPS
jgi:predicted HAD superfamily phosphohydrolase YqeG